MKKYILLVLTAVMVVSSANAAALLDKGSSELAISGWLDFDTADGTEVDLELRYGYFLLDRFSVAGLFDTRDSKHSKIYAIGAIAEYNFTLPEGWRPAIGTDLVPYVGGGLSYAYADVLGFDDDAFIFRGDLGVKFFLTDSAAVTLALVGSWATDDIYADDDELTDLDLQMQLGMRLYF